MSGTFTGKVLSDGFVANAQAAIYTVPASTVAYVKQLYLANINAATQSVILYLNTSGTARQWKVLTLAQNEAADIFEDGESVQLQAGDTVEAVTTTASAVAYTTTGVEET